MALASAALAACSEPQTQQEPARETRATGSPVIIAPGNNTLVSGLGGTAGYGETELTTLGGPAYNCAGGYWTINASTVFPNGFNFLGQRFDAATQFFASTKGYLSFGAANSSLDPRGLDFMQIPIIAGLSAHNSFCNGGNPGRVYLDLDTTAADPVVTVTYLTVPVYPADSFAALDSFQIRLHNVPSAYGSASFGDLIGVELRYSRLDWATGPLMDGQYGTGGWADGNSNGVSATPVASEVTYSGTASMGLNATADNAATNRSPPQPGVYYWQPYVLQALSGGAQQATVNTAFALPLRVQVNGASGTPAVGVPVTFRPAATGASVTISPATVVTDASGEAAVTVTANAVAGIHAVAAFIGTAGLSNAVYFPLQNLAGAATTLAVDAASNNQSHAVGGGAFANPLNVTVRDALGNGVSGATVNFVVPSSGASATLSLSSVVTDVNGLATVTATPNTVAGTYSVAVSSGALTGTITLTNTAGAPATMTVATGASGQTATVNTAFANALAVTVRDTFGNLVPGTTVTYTRPTTGASATLSSTTATTNTSGLASVTATANTVSGTYTVGAAAGAASGTITLTNTAGAPATITLTAGASPQSATVNAAFTNPLALTVRDTFGNAVSGTTVTYTRPATGASANLSSTTATTNTSGVASVTATANTVSGAYSVGAAAGAASGSFALTNLPGTAAVVAANTGASPQTASVNTAFANPLAVTVRDSFGNLVPGATVTYGAPATGASAALSSTTAIANGSGVASVTATANTTAGSYNVTAASGTGSVNLALTNAAGAPSTLSVATGASGQSAAVLTVFANPLAVTVRDAFNNLVPSTTVTYTPPATGASATLSSTTATTNGSGVASVTATANGVAGGPYLVGVAAGSASGSFSLTNNAGAPATIQVAAVSNNQSRTVGGPAFANPLTVTVRDGPGNAVPGVTVNFVVPASGASCTLNFSSVTTDSGGTGSVTATPNTVAGTYQVAVSSGAATGNITLTNTAGAPATIVLASGTSGQSAAASTAFANPLAVTVRDAFGNGVPSTTVTYTPPSSGASASLSSTTATTNASGVASVTATANTVMGAYTVGVAAGAATGSISLTNTAGPPSTIALGTGTSPQSATVNTAFANPLSVTVRDAFGNLVPSTTVTYTPPATGARATLSSTTATTNASGVASVTATANTIAGAYSVGVSAGSATASISLTNLPGGAATLVATSGGGQSASVDGTFAAPLVATVRDSFGNGVPGVQVGFAAPTSGARATLSASTVTTGANGQASVTATPNTVSGSYQVTASSSGLTNVTFALTNLAGVPATITAAPAAAVQTAQIGTAFANPLDVTVVDSHGNPVPSILVTYAGPGTGARATFAPATPVATGTNGHAQVVATANTVTGTYTVTASIPGSLSATFSLTNSAGAPGSISVTSGDAQSATVGAAFAAPLVVTVRDGSLNPVPGVPVGFAAPATGASAALSAASVNTDANGRASVTATANTTSGTYKVTATTAGVSTPAQFDLANNAGAPTTITASPAAATQSAAVGTNFLARLTVTVRDQHGNPVPGRTVTFSGPTSGARAVLSATTATTAADGTAGVDATAGTVVGSYQVSASVAGVTAPAVFSLTNQPGAPSDLAIVSGSPQQATAGASFAAALTVEVKDGFANPVPGVNVSFTAPVTGATAVLSAPQATTGSDGRATVTATAGTVAGAYQVTASAGVGAAPVTFALTNVPGAPVSMVIAPSSGDQSTRVGEAYAAPLALTVADVHGNGVPDVAVAFACPATGPTCTLDAPSDVTDAAGRAEVHATAGTVAGAVDVTATSAGLPPAVFHLTNLVGLPGSIVTVSGNPQSAAVFGAYATPLVAEVADAFQNPVPGIEVSFSVVTTGAQSVTLSSPSATTDAAGRASVTATANGIQGALSVRASATGVLSPAEFALTNTAIATALDVEITLPVVSAVFDPDAVTRVRVEAGPAAGGGSPGGTVTLTGTEPLTAVPGQPGVTQAGGAVVATLSGSVADVALQLQSWHEQSITVAYAPDAASTATWAPATVTMPLRAAAGSQDSGGGCSTGGGAASLLPLLLVALRTAGGRRRRLR